MHLNLSRWGVIGLCLLSASCIYTDRSEDYQDAVSLPVVTLPEDVDSLPLEPLFPIPEVKEKDDSFVEAAVGGEKVPRPEPMSAEREAAKVKIQKVGNRRWVLVEAPAGQVWPLAQSYLSTTGIKVLRSDAASGLIETDWVQFKADATTENHYRIRIEKGVRPESTEVHVLHDQAANAKAEWSWPETSDDPEREAWLLEGLANSLAQSIGNNSASLLGQSIGGESKAELTVIKGDPALVLRLDQARAWATLTHGLKDNDFRLWEEQEADGIFYFQYTGDYKKPNWFVRLFTWGDNAPATEPPLSLGKLLGNLASEPQIKADFAGVSGVSFSGSPLPGSGYLLKLDASEGHYVAKVRDYRGRRLSMNDAKRILATLRRNLI